MGCGASTLDLEESRKSSNRDQPTLHEKSNRGHDQDNDSSSSRGRDRKSVSHQQTRFVRRVIASNEKEGGLDRELEPSRNGRKSFSSQKKNGDQETHYVQEDMKEKDFRRTNPSRGGSIDRDDDHGSNLRESSIAFSPGSPSFREYCVFDDHEISSVEDDGEKDHKESGSLGAQPAKRDTTRSRFRTALHMGAPAGMRNLLHFRRGPASHSHHDKL
ncbi:hypothetical protein Tsubulata_015139 [Turnera subulata]|uniref:Uncharacterized protein n=1 Tax=Turnera subulata TaxID=218843 RepID=A0A9Q0F3C3_9ROSI|nr:hypothetical protein Tsubulata_015139 [Turnera subulata]